MSTARRRPPVVVQRDQDRPLPRPRFGLLVPPEQPAAPAGPVLPFIYGRGYAPPVHRTAPFYLPFPYFEQAQPASPVLKMIVQALAEAGPRLRGRPFFLPLVPFVEAVPAASPVLAFLRAQGLGDRLPSRAEARYLTFPYFEQPAPGGAVTIPPLVVRLVDLRAPEHRARPAFLWVRGQPSAPVELPVTPPGVLGEIVLESIRARRRRAERRRVGLAYTDEDPRRAALNRDLVDRVNAQIGLDLEVTTPATANQEFAVHHPDLGHVCREFQIVVQDAPGRLYRSSAEKWTPNISFFRYDVAGSKRIKIRLR